MVMEREKKKATYDTSQHFEQKAVLRSKKARMKKKKRSTIYL